MPQRPRVAPVLDEVRRGLVHVEEHLVVEGELPGVVEYEGQDDHDQRVPDEGQDPGLIFSDVVRFHGSNFHA